MNKAMAQAHGKITDWKTLETEKGKVMAHLQLQDDENRVSWVLVAVQSYQKWKGLLEKAYQQGDEVEIRGMREDLGTHVRLIAEQISLI